MAKSTLDMSNIIFRPYSQRLLELLNDEKVPLYIISGGISDVIYTTIDDLCGEVFGNVSIHSNEMEMYEMHMSGGHRLVDYRTTGFW